MRTTHAGATTFCALVALVAAVLVVGPTASNAQVTIQDIGEDNPVFGVPSKTAEGCGATLQNSTSDLIIAFSSCLASESASEACCGAIESTFAFENDKFGGCESLSPCSSLSLSLSLCSSLHHLRFGADAFFHHARPSQASATQCS